MTESDSSLCCEEVLYKLPGFAKKATSYWWILSPGIVGSSESEEIKVRFENDFQSGRLLVTEVNDGFGEGKPARIEVVTDYNTYVDKNISLQQFEVQQNQMSIMANFTSDQIQHSKIKVYNLA